MNEDDDTELLEQHMPRSTRRITTCRYKRWEVVIVSLISTILIIQVIEIGIGVHTYNNDFAPIVEQLSDDLDDWKYAYDKLQPYFDKIDELFNIPTQLGELKQINKRLTILLPEITKTLLKLNEYMYSTNKSFVWAETCIKNFGIC